MYRVAIGVGVLLLITPAWADIDVCTDPGYCGTDGILNPAANVEIDLNAAVTGPWETPSPEPGNGVYDSEKWAVVFKYESVNIPAGVTVTFKNHPSGAPVVWLVEGSVLIEGILELNGGDGHGVGDPPMYAEPGPGGFRGGRGGADDGPSSGGFGPGGAAVGSFYGSGGSYAESGEEGSGGGQPGPPYGNSRVLPLIGGSGGSGGGGSTGTGGGAGGGAILIATNTSILLNGNITSNGGGGGGGGGFTGGGGSGGAIRLIADIVEGSGGLRALGGPAGGNEGAGSVGRIRVEAAELIDLNDLGDPHYTSGDAEPVTLWPDATFPVISAVSLANEPISSDPKSGLNFPNQEVFMSSSDPVTLVIEALNVPVPPDDGEMVVRVVLKSGMDFTVNAVYQSGDFAMSTWQADVVMPGEISAVQVRVELP